ncbi:MAG: tetraacyldisaccharide 4'-kinase [Calditrichaeota bacterium]|nr:tetraacyldisaccharide 4'-kinase [Calditrichota bacterium]
MTIFENKIVRTFLFPLSPLYGTVMRLRNFCYDAGVFTIHRLPRTKVISVGNVSVGGTGKTPFCIFLAKELQKMKLRVAILSRGYQRKSRGTVVVSDGEKLLAHVAAAGDEPYLLAYNLPGVPVVCESNRYQGGLFIEKNFHPDVIILDDGFQHRRLHRDLDILLIDATRFRKGQTTLPTGYLREPLSGLKRANLICLSRVDQGNDLEQIFKAIKDFSSEPIVTGSHKPRKLIRAGSGPGEEVSFSLMKNKRVFLFSGIANPRSFEKTIRSVGMIVGEHLVFPDHHNYSAHEIERIKFLATQADCETIITTEKDFTRLRPFSENLPKDLHYLQIEFEILQGKDILAKLIDSFKQA